MHQAPVPRLLTVSQTNNKTTEANANLDKAVWPVLLILEGGHHDIASEHGHKRIAFCLEVHRHVSLEQATEGLQHSDSTQVFKFIWSRKTVHLSI